MKQTVEEKKRALKEYVSNSSERVLREVAREQLLRAEPVLRMTSERRN